MSKEKYAAKKIPEGMGGWSVFDSAGRLIGVGVGATAKEAIQDCLRSRVRELMEDLQGLEKNQIEIADWS